LHPRYWRKSAFCEKIIRASKEHKQLARRLLENMENGDVANEFYPSEMADRFSLHCAGCIDGIREHLAERTVG
jgi:hypothetical protein